MLGLLTIIRKNDIIVSVNDIQITSASLVKIMLHRIISSHFYSLFTAVSTLTVSSVNFHQHQMRRFSDKNLSVFAYFFLIINLCSAVVMH